MIRHERGANLVELAIVTPLLLFMLAGIADLGRAFHSYMIVTNAAREGARAASRLVCYDDTGGFSYSGQRSEYLEAVYDTIRAEVAGSTVDATALTLNMTPVPLSSCPLPGSTIRVTVSFPYDALIGNPFGIEDFTLVGSAAMTRVGKK